MRNSSIVKLIAALSCTILFGCDLAAKSLGTTWHQKCGWKAEDYFDDEKVIALCRSIEAGDLAEIDRLVAVGADVNALGKGKMTPLLWAYPDNKLAHFKKLLELGANPNVLIESDFNTHGGMRKGDSVTHMACKTKFPGYFEAVFANGGDPNLISGEKRGTHDTPLFVVIQFGGVDKKDKIRTLIKLGADINYLNGVGLTTAMTAVVSGRQFDTALELLEAGADPKVFQSTGNSRLVHLVIGKEHDRMDTWSPQQRSDYQKLVKWLAQHGESFDEARADLKRWESWSTTTGEYRRKMDAEIAARKAKEARKEDPTEATSKN